jgi:hypothetical protein
VDFPHSDARRDGGEGIDLPQPIRSGLAVAAVGLLPLALGLAAVIRPLSGLVFAAIFLAAGVLQSSLAHFELIGIRRRADLELRREPRSYLLSRFAQWRASELTSDRERLALARSVARTERDLSPALLPGAAPLNRVAARPHADLFRRIAARLAALDRPVTVQAVLQVEELLTSPESALYARERAREVGASLLACLDALDTMRGPRVAEAALAGRRRLFPARGNRDWPLAMTINGHRGVDVQAAQSRRRKCK